jgi:hypothetical protein
MITIVIVMITTVFGATMLKTFAKYIKLPGSDDEDDDEENYNYNRMENNLGNENVSELVPSNYQHINFDSKSDNPIKNIELESNGTTTQKL